MENPMDNEKHYTPYNRATLATLQVGYEKLHKEIEVYQKRFGRGMPREVYAERHNAIFGERFSTLFSWKEMRKGKAQW